MLVSALPPATAADTVRSAFATAVVFGSIAVAPQIPTVAEAGFPRMQVIGFSGLFGIKDMPVAQRDKIAADIASIVKEPEVIEIMKKNVQIARGSTAAEFQKILDDQRVQVGEMLRTIGMLKK